MKNHLNPITVNAQSNLLNFDSDFRPLKFEWKVRRFDRALIVIGLSLFFVRELENIF